MEGSSASEPSSSSSCEEQKSQQLDRIFVMADFAVHSKNIRELYTNCRVSLTQGATWPIFAILRSQYEWFLLEVHTHLEPSTHMQLLHS